MENKKKNFIFVNESEKFTYTGCIVQHANNLKVSKSIVKNSTPQWHVKCYKMNCLHKKGTYEDRRKIIVALFNKYSNLNTVEMKCKSCIKLRGYNRCVVIVQYSLVSSQKRLDGATIKSIVGP